MVSAVSALPGMTVSGPWTRSRFSGRSGPVRGPWGPFRRPGWPSWRPRKTFLRRWWGLGEFLHNSFWWQSFVCPLIHSFKKEYTKIELTWDKKQKTRLTRPKHNKTQRYIKKPNHHKTQLNKTKKTNKTTTKKSWVTLKNSTRNKSATKCQLKSFA